MFTGLDLSIKSYWESFFLWGVDCFLGVDKFWLSFCLLEEDLLLCVFCLFLLLLCEECWFENRTFFSSEVWDFMLLFLLCAGFARDAGRVWNLGYNLCGYGEFSNWIAFWAFPCFVDAEAVEIPDCIIAGCFDCCSIFSVKFRVSIISFYFLLLISSSSFISFS